MEIYIVNGVRPNLQVFKNLEDAKAFALAKANKRGCTNVWLEWENDYRKACINKEVHGANHIYIYKRII